MIDVAIAQFASGSDKHDNLGQIAKFAGEAAAGGARVLATTEYAMFALPVIDERFVDSAESLDGEFVTGLREIAVRHGLTLVTGINEVIPGERRIFNTLVAVAPDGGIAATYRKLHLFDAFGYRESEFVQAGTIGDPETFTVDGITFGMQTCYDLRFPEVTRRIVDAGADVLVLPAAWMPGPLKEDHWTTLVRARAIENTLYVAAADQCAPVGSGASMIVDPMGVVIASLGERTGTAIGTVSAERIAEVRAKNPALSLRRFGVIAKP
ncbi:carbon-nitrogen hydrolase family protein [Rhodococcus sp. T7]|uniref:carbon-nitrogen hydrolase family protein n=1 Tax=Rhodococcus sp. T7 TaxID=627444 RepID=UPI0013583B0B|nr:carbon-nitrogen hydrolase family protein [Rhodococcus sp. T7]KAF0960733.1 Deaminated glutathione amidase [Rhodococcus sp. T7]